MKLPPEYNDNQIVVAYYRYSSSSQNEASIEQQREMVQRWAKAQGLVVVNEYEDAAKTGTNADRPGYQLMLRELPKIKPAYVAVWKNDRLARDRAELLLAKQAIRAAGARIHYIEGISPTDSPDSVLMEGIADAFAEYYSLQLSANIRRGQRYNAERALSNGHKIFGFTVDTDKRYIHDPETAPIVTQIFNDYASGVSMQKIADRLNAQGIRTTRGYRFTPKNLNKLLKNRAYIGEYSYGGHVIDGGMPRLVEDEIFNEVQRRFAINKRRGAKTKAELAALGDDAPDYWLTGRTYCLTCGSPMDGVSGTSKTGRTYRYYSCLNQRKKKCSAKRVRKDEIELRIVEIIESFLADTEELASLAVDLADHYKKTHGRGDEILKALEARRTDVEAKLANFVKAISQGIFNASTAEAMNALEAQKQELDAAIQAEHVKATLYEDEASIGTFYKRFAQARIDTPETRDQLFEYFIDKIYIGHEQIIIVSYYHDSAGPIEYEDLEEALISGNRAEEVRTYARKREFDTSPWSGDGGNIPRWRYDAEK
ncbi:recombinase family protein [Schaalia sp. ZJ405]|uniref:recombinase family protein n=1 Tax=Schaalia sp. ZJ405 TaxID=2709403 RepID=UPI0013ECF3E3|nr:recombinase family protein [Schaalia sp. ZJ405]QPK80783.1 recombinase family protein [Schaalia sp. ZJ405]